MNSGTSIGEFPLFPNDSGISLCYLFSQTTWEFPSVTSLSQTTWEFPSWKVTEEMQETKQIRMEDKRLVELARFEEIVRCCICLEKYSFPKQLGCQHSFCMCCLAKILRTTLLTADGVLNPGMAISIACPVCKSIHQNISSLNDLKTNLVAVQLLDVLLECQWKTDDIPLCECLKVAAFICITCQREYCLHCREDAQRYCDYSQEHGGPTARHSIVGIGDLDGEEGHKCTKHNMILEYYCTVCEEPVCLDCFFLWHKDHKTTVISSVTQEIQKLSRELQVIHAMNEKGKVQLSRAVISAINKVDGEQLEVSEEINQYRVMVQSFIDSLFEKINAFCDEYFVEQRSALATILTGEKTQRWDGSTEGNFVSFVNSKMSDHLLVAFQASVLRSMLSSGQEKSSQIQRSKEQLIMTAGRSSKATVGTDLLQLKRLMLKMVDSLTLKVNDIDLKQNLKTYLHREFEDLFTTGS